VRSSLGPKKGVFQNLRIFLTHRTNINLYKMVRKNARKGWETFSGYTRFEVGDGTRSSFWQDLWVGDMTLNAAFPALFGKAAAKDSSVANNLEHLPFG
jgi:hypothetical protein